MEAPWLSGRPRRSAAERRQQRARAQFRAIRHLLRVVQHLGGQPPSKLASALIKVLRDEDQASASGPACDAQAGTPQGGLHAELPGASASLHSSGNHFSTAVPCVLTCDAQAGTPRGELHAGAASRGSTSQREETAELRGPTCDAQAGTHRGELHAIVSETSGTIWGMLCGMAACFRGQDHRFCGDRFC